MLLSMVEREKKDYFVIADIWYMDLGGHFSFLSRGIYSYIVTGKNYE